MPPLAGWRLLALVTVLVMRSRPVLLPLIPAVLRLTLAGPVAQAIVAGLLDRMLVRVRLPAFAARIRLRRGLSIQAIGPVGRIGMLARIGVLSRKRPLGIWLPVLSGLLVLIALPGRMARRAMGRLPERKRLFRAFLCLTPRGMPARRPVLARPAVLRPAELIASRRGRLLAAAVVLARVPLLPWVPLLPLVPLLAGLGPTTVLEALALLPGRGGPPVLLSGLD